jgi:hypothetical protein
LNKFQNKFQKTSFSKQTSQGKRLSRLSSESVEGASLALERVDDIHRSDGLAASVLSVGDGIADDVLQKHLQHTAGLFVDQTTDALDTSSASQTTDGRLGDSGNVISQDLAMTLGASLSESLCSLSSSWHSGNKGWDRTEEKKRKQKKGKKQLKLQTTARALRHNPAATKRHDFEVATRERREEEKKKPRKKKG